MVIWYEYKFEDGFMVIRRGKMPLREKKQIEAAHGELVSLREAWRD